MTITVEKMARKQSIRDLMLFGIESSVASMSLVNRFTMRPRGVESKKLISALSTECNRRLCISLVALMNMATKQTLPKNEIKAKIQ